ncbi:toll/interleukin-1 receptor domain-containing protein [Alkalibacterium putridalgicola]|uniref:toll/interleukin-1 receptor domain-containing protein n=1 Tax=Alkalibacterium putridalgicola TaxID=426703 RepID=UPI0034CF825A
MERKKVFVSYSWDSIDHQKWVINLTNQLRRNGIDAEIDLFVTQLNSVSLPLLMATKIRDADYVVIILTEDYATKADQSHGGVGFESHLMMPILMENQDKLIFVMRHQGNYEKVFPFHFKGQYAIDFSNDTEFEEKLGELVYRIYGQPRHAVEPLGDMPDFRTRDLHLESEREVKSAQSKTKSKSKEFDFDIPSLKRITERDIDTFLKESFVEISSLLTSLFEQVKDNNTEFEYDKEEVNTHKTLFKLYVEGRKVNTIKIWFGGMFSSNTINLAYGNYISTSDNAANEIITYHIDDKNELKLKMTMNMLGSKEPMIPKEVVQEIWKHNISHTVK